MFYFKDAPIAPSQIEHVQLGKVAAFRKSVQSDGILTWQFEELDKFESLVRIHLVRHILSIVKRPEAIAEISDRRTNDLGYLELVQEGSDSLQASFEDMQRRFSAMLSFCAALRHQTEQLRTGVDVNAAVDSYDTIAKEMNLLASQMINDCRLLTEHQSTGLRAIALSIPLAKQFGENEVEAYVGLETQLEEMRRAIATLRQDIPELSELIERQPDATRAYIHAKSHLVTGLRELHRVCEDAEELTYEIEAALAQL